MGAWTQSQEVAIFAQKQKDKLDREKIKNKELRAENKILRESGVLSCLKEQDEYIEKLHYALKDFMEVEVNTLANGEPYESIDRVLIELKKKHGDLLKSKGRKLMSPLDLDIIPPCPVCGTNGYVPHDASHIIRCGNYDCELFKVENVLTRKQWLDRSNR